MRSLRPRPERAFRPRTALLSAAAALALIAPATAHARQPPPLRVKDPAALAHERRAAARGEAPGPAAPAASPSPSTAVSGGLNQPGLGAGDNAAGDQSTPPDTTGAIGPNHYVEIVNKRVAVYSRSLGLLGSSMALATFVNAPGGDNVFDPQMQWDQQAGRWFYAAVDVNDLAYGWSKTSDPSNLSTGWCHFFRTADAGTMEDYPKLGHDDAHLLIGTNLFSTAPMNPFVSARIYSIAKPPPGTITTCPGSAPPTAFPPPPVTTPLQTASNQDAFTPVPANTSDGSSTGWVVSAEQSDTDGSGDGIQVWRVTGAGGSPSFASAGEIGVSGFAPPPFVPQPGTSGVLDSLDGRLTQAVAHADPDAGGAEAVWTQHTIATASGTSAVRWYELLPATLGLRQQGNIVLSDLFAFNGAISPTASGNEAVIQYDVGSSSRLAELRAQSRRSATPLGVMGGETTLGQSSVADQDASCSPPPCRWGDYAGASPDPADSTLVWGSNQLIGPLRPTPGPSHWVTRNFALIPTGRPPAPAIAAPDPAGKGDVVRFDASGSTRDGPVADYAWDLDGDGTFETDTGASPVATRTFGRVGPATVSVRVTDDRGQSGVASRQITVVDHPPTAVLTVVPNPAPIPKLVTFDASRSSDVDGRIVDYSWDLDGNGTFETDTGASPRASRSYLFPGKLNPRVRVRDDDGSTGDATVGLTNRDVTAPRVRLSLKATQRLTGSVALTATCSENCRLKCTLNVPNRDAKRLHLARKVGGVNRRLKAHRKTKIKVRFTRRARNGLARVSLIRVKLAVVATDAARNARRISRTVTLRR